MTGWPTASAAFHGAPVTAIAITAMRQVTPPSSFLEISRNTGACMMTVVSTNMKWIDGSDKLTAPDRRKAPTSTAGELV